MVEKIIRLFFEFMQVATPITLALLAIYAKKQGKAQKEHGAKLDSWKQKQEEKTARDNENAAIVFGENWDILHLLKADTVFVIQSHPLTYNLFLSLRFQVKRKGVISIQNDERSQNVPMGAVAKLSAMMATQLFWFRDENTAEDKYAKNIMLMYGIKNAYGCKLINSDGNWVGSVVAANVMAELPPCEIQAIMNKSALIIGMLLPDIPNVKTK